MKKLLFILLLLFANISYAEVTRETGWSRSGSNIILKNSGDKVGIGTTVPIGRLQVGTTPNAALLVVQDNGSVGIGNTAPTGLLQVGTAPNSPLMVLANGNVGIGTTNPATKLEVKGNVNLGSSYTGNITGELTVSTATNGLPAVSGTDQSYAALRLSTLLTTVTMDMGVSGAAPYPAWIQVTDITGLGSTYPLLLQPNGGNVGIGTTNPATTLDVVGIVTIRTGGLGNNAVCWKSDGITLGYCSSAVDASGDCTCN